MAVLPQEPRSAVDFVDGDIPGVEFQFLEEHWDERGSLVELAREDSGPSIAMVYRSLTEPGVMRGPHVHAVQTDQFIFHGRGMLFLWDNRMLECRPYRMKRRIDTTVRGFIRVIIPSGVVHAYRNDHPENVLLVLNCPDQLYKGPNKQGEVDETRYEDDPANPYQPW